MSAYVPQEKTSALVVFSGGQDSTTCLYWALNKFDVVETITFNYGQKHTVELECAKRICELNAVPQRIVDISSFGSLNANALTDASIPVSNTGGFQNLPSTFVPGRNAVFFTYAAAFAATRGIRDIVSGVCQTDYSGYPDCRDDFVAAQEKALSLAMDTSFTFHRPLMFLTKAETFQLAHRLNALDAVIEHSHTCYEGNRVDFHAWGYGCGSCPACELRKKGYEEFRKIFSGRTQLNLISANTMEKDNA